MTERWLPVPGWAAYEVSDAGSVRRSRAARGATVGRVLRASPSTWGYPSVHLFDGERRRRAGVHQLVAEAFLGPAPDGHEVNHRNGIKHDNRVENLEWVTSGANNQHAIDTGLRTPARGERNAAKLTEEQVRAIRSDPRSTRAIGADYGIASRTVSGIKRGEKWSHVK